MNISCLPLLYLTDFPLKLLMVLNRSYSCLTIALSYHDTFWDDVIRCHLLSISQDKLFPVKLDLCPSHLLSVRLMFWSDREQYRRVDSLTNVAVIHSSPNSIVPSVAARARIQHTLDPHALGLRF